MITILNYASLAVMFACCVIISLQSASRMQRLALLISIVVTLCSVGFIIRFEAEDMGTYMAGQKISSTLGLEMEAYGVAYAASRAVEPKPYAIIAKSVCDYADNRKNDNYQKFAAHTSCEFVKLLCEEILPEKL